MEIKRAPSADARNNIKVNNMTFSWNKIAFGTLAVLALCFSSCQVFAQDAAEQFKTWAPKMTAENMADENQVREMEKAQQGWMTLCLQNHDTREQTNKIMLNALQEDYPAVTKAWLLHILGWVGNDACVDGIAKCLTSDDPRIFDEAARALAQIPGDKALQALQAAQKASDTPEKFDSYIKARNVDVTVGVESEAPLALPYVGKADFDAYMKDFNSFDDDQKARALGAVTVRKDKDYRAIAVESVKSANGDVKKAAILALEKIGTAEEFDVLYEQLKTYDRGLMIRVMKNVIDENFNDAVVAALQKETDGGVLAALAEITSGRYMGDQVKKLLEIALKENCPAPLQLMQAAEQLATKDNIPDFVNIALTVKQGGERDRAEQVVARLCEGDATPVIAMMNNQNGPQIFMLIGRVGGDAALKTIQQGLDSNNPQMVALSLRALCNWPNAVVADKLLDAAKNDKLPEQIRVQALRAYIRVVSLPDDQDGVDMSGKDKLNAIKTAFALATRDDERKFALERLGAVRELDSVRFALEQVDKPELTDKALGAILDLAHQDYLRKMDKDLFIKALDVVLEKGTKEQKDRAGNYKSNIR